MTELKPFQAIQYTTSSGENCIATKNNGIVTIKGDKNGVRQMKQDEFMKQFVEDQSKKSLERTPAKDTVTFSGAEKPKMSNNTKGWLVALGTLAVGAGIYALTRGKQGEDAVQKGASELSETINNSSIKNKTSEVVNDIVDDIDIPKPIREIEPEVIRPAASNPIKPDKINPEAIENAVVIPVGSKTTAPIQDALDSIRNFNMGNNNTREISVKPTVIDLGDDAAKEVDNVLDNLKETQIKNNDPWEEFQKLSDDLEKETKKRREQERIDNDNMIMGAIYLDDVLRAGQRNVNEIADDISHSVGKIDDAVDDIITPHYSSHLDDTDDFLRPHSSSLLDDTNDLLSHNSYDDMSSSFDNFGSSYGSSFDSFGDDMMDMM